MRDLRLAVDNVNRNSGRPGGIERRRNLRITAPFTALVRGITETGERSQFRVEIDNLSARGLFLKTNHNILGWKRLTIVIRLSLNQKPDAPAPVIAARGEVLRTEPASPDCAGYAFALQSRRFV